MASSLPLYSSFDGLMLKCVFCGRDSVDIVSLGDKYTYDEISFVIVTHNRLHTFSLNRLVLDVSHNEMRSFLSTNFYLNKSTVSQKHIELR